MSEITKKALAETLKKLLSKNKLNKITIKEITEDCGVNRQTFYYHFKDIYDLLEWIYKNEVIQEIEEKTNYTPIVVATAGTGILVISGIFLWKRKKKNKIA